MEHIIREERENSAQQGITRTFVSETPHTILLFEHTVPSCSPPTNLPLYFCCTCTVGLHVIVESLLFAILV